MTLLAVAAPSPELQVLAGVWVLANLIALLIVLFSGFLTAGESPYVKNQNKLFRLAGTLKRAILYEVLTIGAVFMVLPFYWMIITSFKDAETSTRMPPQFYPVSVASYATPPGASEPVEVKVVGVRRRQEDPIPVVPRSAVTFEGVVSDGVTIHRETWDKAKEFAVMPEQLEKRDVMELSIRNFREAWYAPEESSRGAANFTRYFIVSIVASVLATIGTLITGALAAFAFSRFEFFGKGVLFYVVLATMMVPGQVLLIPNFLILSGLGWLDTYAALVVPWLASVFTIFLMRQFFLGIPNDLWDAAQIDGASHFRYLWQVVVPLSKPVFITSGIFSFLNNWNSLLWPIVVTSSPNMRTLMVGLQTFNEEGSINFHLLMAASTMAIMPVVLIFFLMQRYFIEGIARTGLK